MAAYGTMALFLVVLPIFIDNFYAGCLFSIVSVAIAAWMSNVTILSTSFVLILSTVVLPIGLLYDIEAGNKVSNPFYMILDHLEWGKFLDPLVLGIITLFAVRHLSRQFAGRFGTPKT
jgi:hypothetical protein